MKETEFLFRNGEFRRYRDQHWRELEGSLDVMWDPHGYIYANDGCSHSPDYWRGYATWPACVIHDARYANLRELANGQVDRLRKGVDREFRRNLQTCLRQQGLNRLGAWFLARVYWRAVDTFGGRAL